MMNLYKHASMFEHTFETFCGKNKIDRGEFLKRADVLRKMSARFFLGLLGVYNLASLDGTSLEL